MKFMKLSDILKLPVEIMLTLAEQRKKGNFVKDTGYSYEIIDQHNRVIKEYDHS